MKLFLIAGEPSGDRLGAELIAGLRTLVPSVEIVGIGGPLMQAQGLTSLVPMSELTVMGLAEIAPKYFSLMRHIRDTAARVVEEAPDALVTIDLPEFGLRVARRVRAASPGIRTVHYVAPSVWAWRPGRAAKMAPYIDQVLALLPFEPPYMEAVGIRCDFVGHPVASEPVVDRDAAATLRRELVPDASPLIVVLPGSRRGEVGRLSPIFGEALKGVNARHPGLRVIVPAAAAVADEVAAAVRDWPGRPVVLDPRDDIPARAMARKRTAFAAADLALAASGTVSLELAAAGTPMVIAYTFAPLTRMILPRFALIDTVTLVNLVSETRTVPEFLLGECRPGPIAEGIERLLSDADARSAQFEAMAETMLRLGRGGDPPGLRAAQAVLDGLSKPAV